MPLLLVGILELPSVDGRGTLLDPLEHPPDDAEVGADLRAAATSRQEAPTGDEITIYHCMVQYDKCITQLQLIHSKDDC